MLRTLLDGPPYTTGEPHMGTVFNKLLKDLYWRLFSFRKLIPGFDTHGLPIEKKVQTLLGLNSKKEILSFGIEQFKNECKAYASKMAKKMILAFRKLNLPSFLWHKPYLTNSETYKKKELSAFISLFKNKQLYESEKVLNVCCFCECVLSESEVLELEDVKKEFYFLIPSPVQNEFYLVYTTTAWSICLNKGLVYNPLSDLVYFYDSKKRKIICSKTYAVREKIPFFPFEKVTLKKSYSSLFSSSSLPLLTDELFVHSEVGTGFVHLSPTCSEEDRALFLKKKIPFESKQLSLEGEYLDKENLFFKKNIKFIERDILSFLKQQDLLFKIKKGENFKKGCWRCRKESVKALFNQLFLKVPSKALLKLSKNISWIFNDTGKKAFENWIVKARDWCLSRDRFWGVEIPLQRTNQGLAVSTAGKTGSQVLDVWFDSAFAGLFFKKHAPFDLIIESKDQVRGWFYGLLVLGQKFGILPFRSVLMHGWVLDKNGEPMSKSKGNVVQIESILSLKYGLTLLRLFFFYNRDFNKDILFDLIKVKAEQKKLDILFNCLKFLKVYSKLNGFDLATASFQKTYKASTSESWLLHRLNLILKKFKKRTLRDSPSVFLTSIFDFLLIDFSRAYLQNMREHYWFCKTETPFFFLKYTFCRVIYILKFFLPDLKFPRFCKQETCSCVNLKFKLKKTVFFDFFLDLKKQLLQLKNKLNLKGRWFFDSIAFSSTKTFLFFKKEHFLFKELKVLNLFGSKQKTQMQELSIKSETVFLDVTQTEEVKKNNLIQELQRRIQQERKKLNIDNLREYSVLVSKELLIVLEENNLKKKELEKKTRCFILKTTKGKPLSHVEFLFEKQTFFFTLHLRKKNIS